MARNGGAGAHCIDGEGLIPGVFLYRRSTASDSGMPANRIERMGVGGIGRFQCAHGGPICQSHRSLRLYSKHVALRARYWQTRREPSLLQK